MLARCRRLRWQGGRLVVDLCASANRMPPESNRRRRPDRRRGPRLRRRAAGTVPGATPWLAGRLRGVLPATEVEDVLQETFLALWLRHRGPAKLYVPALVAAEGQHPGDPAEAVHSRAELALAVSALGPAGSTARPPQRPTHPRTSCARAGSPAAGSSWPRAAAGVCFQPDDALLAMAAMCPSPQYCRGVVASYQPVQRVARWCDGRVSREQRPAGSTVTATVPRIVAPDRTRPDPRPRRAARRR